MSNICPTCNQEIKTGEIAKPVTHEMNNYVNEKGQKAVMNSGEATITNKLGTWKLVPRGTLTQAQEEVPLKQTESFPEVKAGPKVEPVAVESLFSERRTSEQPLPKSTPLQRGEEPISIKPAKQAIEVDTSIKPSSVPSAGTAPAVVLPNLDPNVT